MRGGSRKCTFSQYCKWWISLKRILLLTMHILLLNYTNFKTIGAIWKFGVCNHVNWENIRLIARTSWANKKLVLHVYWREIHATIKCVRYTPKLPHENSLTSVQYTCSWSELSWTIFNVVGLIYHRTITLRKISDHKLQTICAFALETVLREHPTMFRWNRLDKINGTPEQTDGQELGCACLRMDTCWSPNPRF